MIKLLEAADVADRVSSAVNETFQSMFKVSAPETSRQKFQDNKLKADVSGIVTMSQESAAGLLVISFPKKMICDLLSKFYGKPFTNLDSTVNMSVGELTNVIYGVAKKVMNQEGHSFGMAIPSIIVGNQHFVFAHFSGEITVMEFTTEYGAFQVYTCLKQRASANRAA